MSMATGTIMATAITTMGKGSKGAAHSGHLSPGGRGRLASEALAKRSKWGEGARAKFEGPVPPHPNPLPSGEREPAAASGPAAAGTAALYRLMAWLSPGYPVGAFSYSGGLEWAVEAGDVRDAETLQRWLEVVIRQGGGFCDAVVLVHAHGAVAAGDAEKNLRAVAELAAALTPSKERHLETTAQGRAFLDATRAAWPCAALDKLLAAWAGPVAYPVAGGGPRHRGRAVRRRLSAGDRRERRVRRGAPHSARPDRRPARPGGTGTRDRGERPEGARHPARRGRRRRLPHRTRQHAPRDPVHAAVPLMTTLAVMVFLLLAAIAAVHAARGFGMRRP